MMEYNATSINVTCQYMANLHASIDSKLNHIVKIEETVQFCTT